MHYFWRLTALAPMVPGHFRPPSRRPRKKGYWVRIDPSCDQGIESDHIRLKQNMPKVGCFQSFTTARRTIEGFEAML